MSLLTFNTGDGEKHNSVPVVECGDLYTYTIPSFSVITVKMRRIRYECIVDEATMIVDGFIKDTPSLQRLYPSELFVNVSCEKACYVEVSNRFAGD